MNVTAMWYKTVVMKRECNMRYGVEVGGTIRAMFQEHEDAREFCDKYRSADSRTVTLEQP